jgi:hypothetical protein
MSLSTETDECAVCGEDVEIGGFPPEYYFPLDQSDVPDHKVNMAPNPSGDFACSYDCLQDHEASEKTEQEDRHD